MGTTELVNQNAEINICSNMRLSNTGSVGTLPIVHTFQIQPPRRATVRVIPKQSSSESWHERRCSMRAVPMAPLPKAADISGQIELLIRFIPWVALREMVRAVLKVTTAVGPITYPITTRMPCRLGACTSGKLIKDNAGPVRRRMALHSA